MLEGNDDRFPVRKNPRLKGYDYATPNYSFITLCTYQKKCIFGKPGALNSYGQLARRGLLRMEEHFAGLTVDKFVVMPNHIHAIVVLSGNNTFLPTAVGLYKSFVSKEIHKMSPEEKVWQASFHDHVIRDQKDYLRIWSYIDSNPSTWLKDCFFVEDI